MATLRIVQSGANVDVSFVDDGLPPQKVTRPFSFSLSAQDAEDIRWYLEDYLVYPLDPAPKIAERIEHRIREIGKDLFHQVLAGTDVSFKARERLEDMRVEVESDVRDAIAPRGVESVVSISFDPQGDRTNVTLRHAGVPDDEMGRRRGRLDLGPLDASEVLRVTPVSSSIDVARRSIRAT